MIKATPEKKRKKIQIQKEKKWWVDHSTINQRREKKWDFWRWMAHQIGLRRQPKKKEQRGCNWKSSAFFFLCFLFCLLYGAKTLANRSYGVAECVCYGIGLCGGIWWFFTKRVCVVGRHKKKRKQRIEGEGERKREKKRRQS